jgi:hypothetical protein
MEGVKYGYARTSTGDQTTALQLAALRRARCSNIFEDKGQSGATAKRPALARCLKALRPGDTLIVWKLDRRAAATRSDSDAGRPPRPWREISFAHGGNRHGDPDGPRHVANDRRVSRARKGRLFQNVPAPE